MSKMKYLHTRKLLDTEKILLVRKLALGTFLPIVTVTVKSNFITVNAFETETVILTCKLYL